MTTATAIVKFEVGNKYECRSVCNYDCVWVFEVEKRTACTIRTRCGKTLRINKEMTQHFGEEMCFPIGNYSMAPILKATKCIK